MYNLAILEEVYKTLMFLFVDSTLGFSMHNRHTGRLAVHGEAGDKASLYRDRYQVLLQRLSRDKYFSKPAFDTVATEDSSCEVFLPATLYVSIID
jgi:hypothetical protein